MSRANLAIFETNLDSFCERFVTQDECWVHHFETEIKLLLMIKYLRKGSAVDVDYYPNLLRQLRKETKSKRPGMLTKGVLFPQDNAPAHKSLVAMSAIRDSGFELFDHPFYSLDLAFSDFYLFSIMKTNLSGKRY